jgi:hypothetical protein
MKNASPRLTRLAPHRALFATMLLLSVAQLAGCSSELPAWPTVAVQPTTTATVEPAQPSPSRVVDPLVPTLAPTLAPAPLTATVAATATAVIGEAPVAPTGEPATATPGSQAPVIAAGEPGELASRLGVGVPLNVAEFTFDADQARALGLGWYLDWSVRRAPLQEGNLEFAQMVRVRGDVYRPERAEIVEAIAANPGALWLIGNEPDVQWQDNTTPAQYAALYHQLYTLIKTLDPSAQVAIGAISQVTPLRLQYLEEVLAAYEALVGAPMPVDVWNIHTFVLREERDSWGVSIPPGFDVDQGMLWEIEDHDDLELFQQQIVDFRRWMERHGERNKPLIVSEYGILMPAEYGFPPESVADYMRATFDYLLNARDETLGYPDDDNRLVQKLAWFSLSDTTYPTGNLLDASTGELTELGQAFAEYASSLSAAQPAEEDLQ